MSAILHLIIYIPAILVVGAFAYRHREQAEAVSHRVAARLKALR